MLSGVAYVIGPIMLLPILFVCIASAAARERPPKCHTCVKVETRCYNMSYILKFDAPFRNTVVISRVGILRSKNTLYYAFEPKISDPEYSKVGYINLDDRNISGIVTGSNLVSNIRTFDIDQDNNIVYLGGSDAIYILDNHDKAIFYSSGGDNIKCLFFKNNVLFVRDGENKIVEKRDELFRPYEEYRNVKNFVIDKSNNLVFLNITGLYLNRFRTSETVYLSRNSFFRGLTTDLDGTVYAWWVDGIYKVIIEKEFEDSRVVKVADVSDIGALTFDNDNNFLFTSGKGLFRLSETNDTVTC